MPTVDSTSSSISSSSSSSDGKGGKGKGTGKGKGKGPTDSRGTKRQRTGTGHCWHFTNHGKCNNGDDCPKNHDLEARRQHLERELANFPSTKVVQQPGAYGNGYYGTEDGDDDGNWP
jgi:hypothetical protein